MPWRERNSGPTNELTVCLTEAASASDDIAAVYGVGSYFRHEPHNDVDLVVVVSCGNHRLLTVASRIRKELKQIGEAIGEDFDIIIFTVSEFASGPLRDMDDLVPLYKRT